MHAVARDGRGLRTRVAAKPSEPVSGLDRRPRATGRRTMLHQYVPLLLALHMPTAVRLPAAAQSMAAGTRHQPLRASASEDVGKLTIPQLKERLRAAGLKVGGRKAELVSRLQQAVDREAKA